MIFTVVTVQCHPVGKLENALLSSNSILGLFPSAVVECPQRGVESLLVGDIGIEGSSKPMIIFCAHFFDCLLPTRNAAIGMNLYFNGV